MDVSIRVNSKKITFYMVKIRKIQVNMTEHNYHVLFQSRSAKRSLLLAFNCHIQQWAPSYIQSVASSCTWCGEVHQAVNEPCDLTLVQQMFDCLWLLTAVAAGWLHSHYPLV